MSSLKSAKLNGNTSLDQMASNIEEQGVLQQEKENLQNLISLTKQLEADKSKPARAKIKELSEQLKDKFKDYRGHMLKTSLVRDLPATIINVCERSIQHIENSLKKLQDEHNNLRAAHERQQERMVANELAERIYAYKDEYIRGYETISKGVRGWDCLISLVEDGTVKEDDLLSYGIDLSCPPES